DAGAARAGAAGPSRWRARRRRQRHRAGSGRGGMGVSADKLRLLRQQAGQTLPSAPVAAPPPATEPVFAWIEREVRHKAIPEVVAPVPQPPSPLAPKRGTDIDALRRLIGLRERAVAAPSLPARRPA